MSEIKGVLMFASVADDASGIHLRIQRDDEKLEVCFLPVGEQIGDISLVLRPGMNAKKELTKVADLLNGFRTLPDGSVEPIPSFRQKRVTIINE